MGGILLKWVKFNEFHHSGSKSTRTASEPCKKAYELLLFSASGAEGCFLVDFTWISHFSIKIMISTGFHGISWKWWNLWFSWPKVVPFAAGAVGLTIYKRIHRYPHALLGEFMEFLTKTAKSAPFMILWWFHGNQWISWKIMKMMGIHRNELPRSCEIVQ